MEIALSGMNALSLLQLLSYAAIKFHILSIYLIFFYVADASSMDSCKLHCHDCRIFKCSHILSNKQYLQSVDAAAGGEHFPSISYAINN